MEGKRLGEDVEEKGKQRGGCRGATTQTTCRPESWGTHSLELEAEVGHAKQQQLDSAWPAQWLSPSAPQLTDTRISGKCCSGLQRLVGRR